MLERNGVEHDDLISILFTATPDVHSVFPAAAAREMGLGDVPLICAQELDIVGAMPLCIRVMMHLSTELRSRRAATRLPGAGPQPAGRPPGMIGPAPRRAGLVGTGLIGGSVGLALRAAGWHVTGTDLDATRAERALDLGVLDAVGVDPDAEITFVAVPVSAVPAAARVALDAGGVVTDVGSVKAPVVAAVDHPRFVGGHPMAGSEAIGVDGARADLFDGAAWVLTPTPGTDQQAHALVHSVVRSFGADVLTLAPEQHDRLVATVSHVPHLTAAALMQMAATRVARATLRCCASRRAASAT